MVTHYRIGDPDLPGSVYIDSSWCNCACQRCLDGGCCRFPDPNWPNTTGTVTTWNTSTRIECGAIDHDFTVLDPARLYCRKCGAIRSV